MSPQLGKPQPEEKATEPALIGIDQPQFELKLESATVSALSRADQDRLKAQYSSQSRRNQEQVQIILSGEKLGQTYTAETNELMMRHT